MQTASRTLPPTPLPVQATSFFSLSSFLSPKEYELKSKVKNELESVPRYLFDQVTQPYTYTLIVIIITLSECYL